MAKVYSQQEKAEAPELVREVGTGTKSERLGISQDTLYTWAAKERKRKETADAIMAEKGPEGVIAENERLKKELAERSEEVEILKDDWVFSRGAKRSNEESAYGLHFAESGRPQCEGSVQCGVNQRGGVLQTSADKSDPVEAREPFGANIRNIERRPRERELRSQKNTRCVAPYQRI
jgi:transposase-like protein